MQSSLRASNKEETRAHIVAQLVRWNLLPTSMAALAQVAVLAMSSTACGYSNSIRKLFRTDV